jgi:hypothetical protein
MDARRERWDEQMQVVEVQAVVVGGRRRIARCDPDHACQACGQRRSRFFYRGAVRADRTHTLCFECYRKVVNQARARRLADALDLLPLPSRLPGAANVHADREALYGELQRRRRLAQIAAGHAAEGWTAAATAGTDAALEKVS